MKKLSLLVFYLSTPLLAGFIGSVFTIPAIPSWYVHLNKPSFTPPSWLFGPVWTLLYLMMGYAAYLVSKSNAKTKTESLKIYWLQLAANILWSVIFFGLQNPLLAFLEIVFLLGLILTTVVRFYRISTSAAYFLLPYALWVSFATVLNFSIVLLN